MSGAKRLLEEIAVMAIVQLGREPYRSLIKRIVGSEYVCVDEETYKQLIVREVVNRVSVDVTFAFPPYNNHTVREVKEKALKILRKCLERDRRIYLV
ncbi:MAG: hypothetical protein DRJ69_00165 [Thermoprotei archaeon]|nr:MAG: hypothetical protein DRJ69_00165 [Thermoprotei archaeon]